MQHIGDPDSPQNDLLEFARRVLVLSLALVVLSAMAWVGLLTPDFKGLSNSLFLTGGLSIVSGTVFGLSSKESFFDAVLRDPSTFTNMTSDESRRLAIADERAGDSHSRLFICAGVVVATFGAVVGYFA